MKRAICLTFGIIFAATCSGSGQEDAQTHINNVMNSFAAAPDAQGLLPTAFAEAEIAAQHAGLALRDPSDIDAIKSHATHVMHALDPSIQSDGPGLGFGLKSAAESVAQQIELAATATDASTNVVRHSVHVATAAHNVVSKIDGVVALLQQLQNETNAGVTAMLIARVETAVGQIAFGVDANEDGQITWEASEGGLRQAQQHMELMTAED
jgi:hypothetical protein